MHIVYNLILYCNSNNWSLQFASVEREKEKTFKFVQLGSPTVLWCVQEYYRKPQVGIKGPKGVEYPY
jgi:hypothetical protein